MLLEQLPDMQFFENSGRPMATIRFKDDWNGVAPYRKSPPMSPIELEVCRTTLQEMEAAGVIERSASPYGSPVLMVPKEGGKGYRLVVDFRAINKLVQRDAYALPTVESILNRCANARYFTVLDVLSAFHQILLLPEHR